MSERVVTFGSKARLIGLLSEAEPSERGDLPAVVLLNSGLIHRVAPNRLYVRIARQLAERGHDCLRFDFSGIGDSSVRTDALPVEQSGLAETREAMDLLQELRGSRSFILMGLCGGGYFSFRTACHDDRVVGLALLNTRGHLHGSDAKQGEELEELAMTLHYRRIATAASYRKKNILKVLRGQFDVKGAFRSLVRRAGDERPRRASSGRCGEQLDQLLDRGIRMLHLYSEGDWSLDYLTAALGDEATERLSRQGSRFELITGTNHVFSVRWSQDHVVQTLVDWITSTPWETRAAST